MSNKNGNNGNKGGGRGYSPIKKGYRPAGGGPGSGHKPESSEVKPTSPPKNK